MKKRELMGKGKRIRGRRGEKKRREGGREREGGE